MWLGKFVSREGKWCMWLGKFVSRAGINVYYILLTGDMKIPADEA